MTRRERLTRILDGLPVDRLAWTTLVDETTLNGFDGSVGAMSALDFYRHIGCDILQTGNHQLPAEARAQYVRLVQPADMQWRRRGDVVERRLISPWGELTTEWRRNHPTKYTVGSLEELRLLTRIWIETQYEEQPDSRASEQRAMAAVGNDGLYVVAMEPSPVQQLIQVEFGLEGFYYFLADYRSEMEELMTEMQRCRQQEYAITAAVSVAPALMAIENTSSTLTSPSYFRRYSLQHLTQYVEAAHGHQKKIIFHMCGLLHHLLPLIAETGLDAINALTPPPVGDCFPEDALDRLGEDMVLLGTTLPAFQEPDATRDTIWRALDEFYSPRVRQSHMLLWVVADGLPTPIERFEAVREWVDRQA